MMVSKSRQALFSEYILLSKTSVPNSYRNIRLGGEDYTWHSPLIEMKPLSINMDWNTFSIEGLFPESIEVHFLKENAERYGWGVVRKSRDIILIRSDPYHRYIHFYLTNQHKDYINLLFPDFVNRDKRIMLEIESIKGKQTP